MVDEGTKQKLAYLESRVQTLDSVNTSLRNALQQTARERDAALSSPNPYVTVHDLDTGEVLTHRFRPARVPSLGESFEFFDNGGDLPYPTEKQAALLSMGARTVQLVTHAMDPRDPIGTYTADVYIGKRSTDEILYAIRDILHLPDGVDVVEGVRNLMTMYEASQPPTKGS